MRVVRRSSDELVLRRAPVLPWALGGLLLVVGAWLALKLNEEGRVVLDCNRPTLDEGRCRFQSEPIVGDGQGVEINASQLEEAFIKTTRYRGRTSKQVVLRTSSGREIPVALPLGQLATDFSCDAASNDERRALVTRLNQFLQGEAHHVHHLEDHRSAIGALAVTLLALGWLIALGLGGAMTLTFDKKKGLMIQKKIGLIGARAVVHELSDIVRVRSATSPAGAATVTLVIGSGETLEVARFNSRGLQRRDTLVEELQAFLQQE
jgi:hypothetical protein